MDNLGEVLAMPQNSMADLTTLDLASGGLDFVSVPAGTHHLLLVSNNSFLAVTNFVEFFYFPFD